MRPPRKTPTLTEALEDFTERRLQDLNTGHPGRVESVSGNRATVQPLIYRTYLDEDGEQQSEPYPVITEVPLLQFGASSGGAKAPVAPGDLVWLEFSKHSLDKWLAGDLTREVDHTDDRLHHLSDAVAHPWWEPAGTEPTWLADTYLTALETLISAIATAAAGVGGGVTTAINTAFATFKTTVQNTARSKLEVK